MVSNSRKVISGLYSQTFVTLLLGVLEIGTFAILSRLLSKEDFGCYAVISAVALIFQSFSEAGIGSAIIQTKDFSENYRNAAFSISLVMGLACSALLLVSSSILSRLIVGENLQKPLMLMSVVVLLHSLISVNVGQMKRKLMFLKVGLLECSARIVGAVVAVCMAYVGYGFYAIIANTMLYSVSFWLLTRVAIGGRYVLVFRSEHFRQIVSYGGWLTFSVVLRNVYNQMDKLLMSRLFSVELLGAYNRPKEFIFSISSRLNSIFDTVLFPILSGVQNQKYSLQNAFNKSLYLMNIFSMLLTLSFLMNHELFIRIFFGEKWMATAPVFLILSVALIVNADNRLCDCFFRSLAFVKCQFYIRVIQIFVVLVAIVVGSFYGIVGVAFGYLATGIVTTAFKVFFIAHRIEVSFSDVIKTVLSAWHFGLFAVPLCLALYYVMPHTFIGNVIMLACYSFFMASLFLFIPRIVGSRYYIEIYPKLSRSLKKIAFECKNVFYSFL